MMSGCTSDDVSSQAPRVTTAPGATARPDDTGPIDGAGTTPAGTVPGTAPPGTDPSSAAPSVPENRTTAVTAPRGVTPTATPTKTPATTRSTIAPATPPPTAAPGAGPLGGLESIGNTGNTVFHPVQPSPGAAVVTGRITDGRTHLPIVGATVWMLTAEHASLEGATITGPDGRYTFASMRPGQYRVNIADPVGAHVSVFAPSAPDFQDATSYNIVAGPNTIDASLFAVADQPVPPFAGAATGRKIAAYGDSLVQLGTRSIRNALEPLGALSVSGIGGQRFDQMQSTALKEAAGRPTTVVIALGTNDALQSWPIEATLAALRDQAALFTGATCIAVVNVNAHTAMADVNDRARLLDDQLAAVVATLPHARVLDWSARAAQLVVSGAPGVWFTDSIHMTAAGSDQYAGLMADAVRSCDPR